MSTCSSTTWPRFVHPPKLDTTLERPLTISEILQNLRDKAEMDENKKMLQQIDMIYDIINDYRSSRNSYQQSQTIFSQPTWKSKNFDEIVYLDGIPENEEYCGIQHIKNSIEIPQVPVSARTFVVRIENQ